MSKKSTVLTILVISMIAVGLVVAIMSQITPLTQWTRGLQNVNFATYSPNGLWVVASSGGASSQTVYPEISVFSLDRNADLENIAVDSNVTTALAFTSNSDYLISQLADSRVKIWDSVTWQPHAEINITGLGCDIDIHPHINLAVIGTCGPSTNGIYVLDVETTQIIDTVSEFENSRSTQVAYSSSAMFLAYSYSVENRTTITIVDLANSEMQMVIIQESITDIDWEPNSDTLFLSTDVGEILYWNVEDEGDISSTTITQTGQIADIEFAQSGEFFLVGGEQKATMYDTDSWNELHRYGQGNVLSISISQDEDEIIVVNIDDGTRSRQVSFFDIETNQR